MSELPLDKLDVIDRTELPPSDDQERAEYRIRHETEAERLARMFPQGKLVRHPQFGLGRIKEVTVLGLQTRAVVDFNAAGRKNLILQHARLEPAG